jgi:hypothetical protein
MSTSDPEIPLPTTFTLDQFNFKLIERHGDLALFEKNKAYPSKKLFKTFEVVIVQHLLAHQWPDGRITPKRESLPKNEEWGTHGWSLQTKDDAFRKLKELLT